METARVSAKGGHAHIQVIPIPRALSSKMGDAFTTVAAQRGVDFAEDTAGALEACKEGVRGYFRVDLPDGTTMVHMIRERGGFNLQFGRLDSCDSSSMSSVLTSSTERLLPKCLEWRREPIGGHVLNPTIKIKRMLPRSRLLSAHSTYPCEQWPTVPYGRCSGRCCILHPCGIGRTSCIRYIIIEQWSECCPESPC
jgi:hypothetical protein